MEEVWFETGGLMGVAEKRRDCEPTDEAETGLVLLLTDTVETGAGCSEWGP
jgi:hypothetical protein